MRTLTLRSSVDRWTAAEVLQLPEDDTAPILLRLRTAGYLKVVKGRGAGVRYQLSANGSKRKVSLRATDDRVDVSRIARAGGGGGHRRAAGFSTDMEFGELVEFLRGELAEQL